MGFSKPNIRSVVGLDIESGFLAAAEVTNGGSPTLTRAATGTLRPGLFRDGEVLDEDGVAEQLKAFFLSHKLPKRVRLGIASQRTVVRVLELPLIQHEQELEAAVRFQAQEELPMPLEQAVLDHHVLERLTDGESARMRVLVVGARRDSVEHLVATARKAGLAPELVDLSAFAMIRALYVGKNKAGTDAAAGSSEELDEDRSGEPDTPADGVGTMYCYVGGITNLAIAIGTNCVFNRVLPNGIESMAAVLAERKALRLEHARQWLTYVGLEHDVEKIDGEHDIVEEARQVLLRGTRRIADEVRLSLEYYQSAVPDARRVEELVMAGPGIAINGLPPMLETELGLAVQPRSLGQIEVSPGALDGVDGAQLTVATGLALDEVTA